MSLSTDLTTELAATQAAVDAMKATLDGIDYAISVDALSSSTPATTRASRAALRASVQQAYLAASSACAAVKAQAAALDPVVTGYAAAVATARTALATGGSYDSTAIEAVQTDVEEALGEEVGEDVAFDPDVTGALSDIEASYVVDATDATNAKDASDQKADDLATSLASFRAGTAAVTTLTAGASADLARLGSLLALAKAALAADRPWQAAVHLSDAMAAQARLTGAIDLGSPGFDVDDETASPATAWTTRAKDVLAKVAAWSTPLADYATKENARIDGQDRATRYADERLVRLSDELETKLTS